MAVDTKTREGWEERLEAALCQAFEAGQRHDAYAAASARPTEDELDVARDEALAVLREALEYTEVA